MTSHDPIAGAASRHGDGGPGPSFLSAPSFEPAAIRGLISATVPGARSRPASVALRLADPSSPEAFEILLTDERSDHLLPLGRYSDEDVVAVWRALGASSGLPLTIEHPDGGLHRPFPQIGRLQLGGCRVRRRRGILNERRPRFLTRRKTGRLPVRPAIHREREIIAGGPV